MTASRPYCSMAQTGRWAGICVLLEHICVHVAVSEYVGICVSKPMCFMYVYLYLYRCVHLCACVSYVLCGLFEDCLYWCTSVSVHIVCVVDCPHGHLCMHIICVSVCVCTYIHSTLRCMSVLQCEMPRDNINVYLFIWPVMCFMDCVFKWVDQLLSMY